MGDDRPVLDQVNLVVRDMEAMVGFYERLGVDVQSSGDAWDRHHRTVGMPEGLDFDLDSAAFARVWNPGSPDGQTGPVLGFHVESREAVDRIYGELTGAGYQGQQPPYDAFFGARYAVVLDPDGNAVGLMSPRDPDRNMPVTPPEDE